MKTVIMQGHYRHGWDTETVESMEDIHAYLRSAHTGPISVYINGIEFEVPKGIGNRY